jgi:hypothetical protein
MNPPWSKTKIWLEKAFLEVTQRDCEVWAVLPGDRLNKVFFNQLLIENDNWFLVVPQDGGGQKFNFYNPLISPEENEQNIKNGGFAKQFLILYIGKNSAEYSARWKAEQPIVSVVLR